MSEDQSSSGTLEHVHDPAVVRDILVSAPARATRNLRLFAPTLSDALFNSTEWGEALARFCAQHQNNHFYLLLEDAATTRRRNPILFDNFRKVSDRVSIRETTEPYRGLREFLLIIDDSLVLHQPSLDNLDSVLIRDYRPRIRDFTDRFQRMWQRATLTTLSTTGL
ncbi:MAG: hypothetical protein OEZ10_07620 [Gammaproteobacteria bacterium]|nr:hypothetical protein [Gammaproteobacteria bacterium]